MKYRILLLSVALIFSPTIKIFVFGLVDAYCLVFRSTISQNEPTESSFSDEKSSDLYEKPVYVC